MLCIFSVRSNIPFAPELRADAIIPGVAPNPSALLVNCSIFFAAKSRLIAIVLPFSAFSFNLSLYKEALFLSSFIYNAVCSKNACTPRSQPSNGEFSIAIMQLLLT